MEPGTQKVAALIVVAGSVLFLAAAFSPISRVYAEPDAARRLEIILAGPNQWLISHLLFGLGAAVTAAGIGWLASALSGRPSAVWLYACAALLLIGAVLWGWHLYLRVADPEAFATRTMPAWHFFAYTFLTQAALVLFGVGLLRTALPPWVGWLAIGSMALFFVLTIITGDMPPFVYYLVTLTAGVMLYRAAGEMAAAVA